MNSCDTETGLRVLLQPIRQTANIKRAPRFGLIVCRTLSMQLLHGELQRALELCRGRTGRFVVEQLGHSKADQNQNR